jgi:DNA-3-methyladenine glycosylase II
MPIVTLTPNESPELIYLAKKDKRLAKLFAMVGPITYQPHDDSYAFLVHEIIEQMLSIMASAKIYGRLEELCGGVITVDAVNNLTDEQVKSIGTSTSKVSYIRNLTNAIESRQLDFDLLPILSDKEVIKKLATIRGIGT